jgi:hypothetical protein
MRDIIEDASYAGKPLSRLLRRAALAAAAKGGSLNSMQQRPSNATFGDNELAPSEE